MQFVTSDTHFFHQELLGQNDFAPRPFNSLAEEHLVLVNAWNARVGELDTVYHHQFFLTHYPMMFGKTDSSINLHGHIHHYSVAVPENINVGVDSADLDYLMQTERPAWGTPLSLDELDIIIQRKHDAFAKGR